MSYEGLLNYLTNDAEKQKERILAKVQEEITRLNRQGKKSVETLKIQL